MTFKNIRENSLNKWLSESKRTRNINDDFSNSIECEWQQELVPHKKHNSLFCSIGEWSTNITDLLDEKTYDNLSFDNKDDRQKLFRQYTRILLISSEILTDFQDFIVYVGDFTGNYHEKNKKATQRLNDINIEFTCKNLFDYINNVCKHKIGNKPTSLIKYHICNHHIDYHFKDGLSFQRIPNSLKVKNIRRKKIQADMQIEVPKLDEIIDQILYGYKALNKALNQRGKKRHIRNQLSKFEDVLEE